MANRANCTRVTLSPTTPPPTASSASNSIHPRSWSRSKCPACRSPRSRCSIRASRWRARQPSFCRRLRSICLTAVRTNPGLAAASNGRSPDNPRPASRPEQGNSTPSVRRRKLPSAANNQSRMKHPTRYRVLLFAMACLWTGRILAAPTERDAVKLGVEAPAPPGQDDVKALAAQGRSQYLAGESAAAAETFRRVEAQDPFNKDARFFLQRIANENAASGAERSRTSAQMLGEVNRAWQRPGMFTEKETVATQTGPSPLLEKLNRIVLPSVNFSGMELGRVVNTLSAVSEEFDITGATRKGVNIVLLDQGNANPIVNITLRNLPLKRVLDFITNSVGYQYEVQADAVVVRPGGEQSALETQFFAVSRSTVLRMTGKGATANAAGGTAAAVPAATVEGEGQAIRNFLQLAGVSFESVNGSTLAFDGSQLIATQTPRNLERILNILNRYNDVRQVEIEAKFMEVQQGALDELGVQWNVATKPTHPTPC